jgi:hypothetical protein
MLPAIRFDDQLHFEARKVGNVVVNRHLAAKSKPEDLSLPQETPQDSFRVCHVPAELSRIVVWHWCGGYPPSSFG